MGLSTSRDKQKLQNKDQLIFIQIGFAVKSYVFANQENKKKIKGGYSFNCRKLVISNNFCSVLIANPTAKVCVTLSRIDIVHQFYWKYFTMDKTTNVKRPRHIKSERVSQKCYKQRISLDTFFISSFWNLLRFKGAQYCTLNWK